MSLIRQRPRPSRIRFGEPVLLNQPRRVTSSGRKQFLAYSCAAARDSHPLPCLRRGKDARSEGNEKERLQPSDEFTVSPLWKSNAQGATPANRQDAMEGQPPSAVRSSAARPFAPSSFLPFGGTFFCDACPYFLHRPTAYKTIVSTTLSSTHVASGK